jgi:hypothetical protein
MANEHVGQQATALRALHGMRPKEDTAAASGSVAGVVGFQPLPSSEEKGRP